MKLLVLTLLLLTAAAACVADDPLPGSGFSGTPTAIEPDELIAPASDVAPASAGGAAPLTVADLDRYVRGKQAEIALLHQASRDLDAASDADAQLEILMNVLPARTQKAAAAAVGVSVQNYERLVDAVDEVLGKLEMRAATAPMLADADTTSLSAEQRAGLRSAIADMEAAWGDPYAGLDPAVARALEARADAFAGLRAELVGLQIQLAR